MNQEIPSIGYEAPKRAGTYEQIAAQQPRWFRHTLGKFLNPSKQEWQQITAALLQGDPLMDAWVDWMFTHQPGEARKLFDQALQQGIETVPNPPAPLAALFASIDTEPNWVDRDKFNRAIEFIHRTSVTGQFVLRDLSLMGGYLLSDFNQALVLTGALQNSARKRLLETSKWWFDVTQPDAMTRFSAGLKSTLHVRMIHALVRRNLPNKPEWQADLWGLPVNQIDMMATCYAFSTVYLTGLRAFGVPVTKADSDAVMHYWKYVGQIMGVDNIWLQDSELKSIPLLCKAIHAYSKPDWTSKALGKALADEVKEHQWVSLKDYPKLHDLMIKIFYSLHVGNSALLLNKSKRRKLGIPDNIPPWFPVLTAAPRFGAFTLGNMIPSLRKRQAKAGRTLQAKLIGTLVKEKSEVDTLIQPESLSA